MLWRKVKLREKKHLSILQLSLQEWTFLSDLLKNGYPLLMALQFLGKDIAILERKLEQGEDITVILVEKQNG